MEEQVKTEYTFCRICESLCGLKIEKQGNKILKIRPDNEHVATRGFGCPKGLKQHHMYDSPDRLKYPMMREGNEWKRVSWEESYEKIGAKVKQILAENGPDSIAMYVGTAAGFSVLHPAFAQGFMDAIGSESMYASASQDCSNKFSAANEMYGFPFTQPFPDLHNTNCMIVVGANPVVSKWSFLQVPNPSKHLKEMEARGCKIYFIDPRKTESAKVAGKHVFIRPGTDIFFYLAFLNELILQEGVQKERVEKFMSGYKEVQALAANWSPEKCETVTHIPAAILRQMVSDYRKANGACLYSSTGVNMGTNGTLAFWIQECINAISGNLDKIGGTLIGKGVIDFPKFGKKNGILTKTNKSRIGNFMKVNDAYPGGVLADEILSPGKKQIRALFVTGGNPLITMPNSNRLREAFGKLDLLVSLDILPGETASIGTFMLPCTSPLQRPDLPFIFPLMLGLQAKPYLQATRRVREPEYEQRDEATIYLDLAKACGVSLFGSKIAQRMLEWSKRRHTKKLPKGAQPALPQEGLLSLLLRITRQGSFKKLLAKKHGRRRNDHEGNSFLGKRVYTESGLVNLAPEMLIKQSKTLELVYQQELDNQNRFKLITKRAVTTHNSWTHNFEDFVANERFSNYLYMHSKDAARLNLENKQLVDVKSATATVRLPIKMLDDLMPGTVALPHGWGHQHSLLQVANKTTGVNVNILSADGPENLEKVSGMAHLTAILVEIKAAAGPLSEKSWSGMPEDELPELKII